MRNGVPMLHNGGQVFRPISRTVGIIPFKGSGSNPDTDAEGFSFYGNRIRRKGCIVGAAVKQQAAAFHALFPPLGILGRIIRGVGQNILYSAWPAPPPVS